MSVSNVGATRSTSCRRSLTYPMSVGSVARQYKLMIAGELNVLIAPELSQCHLANVFADVVEEFLGGHFLVLVGIRRAGESGQQIVGEDAVPNFLVPTCDLVFGGREEQVYFCIAPWLLDHWLVASVREARVDEYGGAPGLELLEVL